MDAAVAARSGGTAFSALSPEVVEAAALAGQLAAGAAVTPFRRAMVQLLLFFADTYRWAQGQRTLLHLWLVHSGA